MPDVIKFRRPILSKAGETDFALRLLQVDMAAPLVKMLLQQVDDVGAFVENGETFSVRHEGPAAEAFLARPEYKAVMGSLPEALVAGQSLPEEADLIARGEDSSIQEPVAPPAPPPPAPEEPPPPEEPPA
jgi:hypothetical protein